MFNDSPASAKTTARQAASTLLTHAPFQFTTRMILAPFVSVLRSFALLSLLVVACNSASADVTLTARETSVESLACVDGNSCDPQSDVALFPDLFAPANVHAMSQKVGTGSATGSAEAGSDVQILSDPCCPPGKRFGAHIIGMASANGGAPLGNTGQGLGRVSYDFTVGGAGLHQIQVSGNISVSGRARGTPKNTGQFIIQGISNGGTLYSRVVDGPGNQSISAQLTLEPGSYRIRADLSSDAQTNRVAGDPDFESASGTLSFLADVTSSTSGTPTPTPTLTPSPTPNEIHWHNPAGGLFNAASNWDPEQVPGANDDVVFDLSGTYSVELTGNVTSKKVRANGTGMNITLSLNGFSFTSDQFTGGGFDSDDLSVTLTGSATPSLGRSFSSRTTAASPALPWAGGGRYQPALFSVRGGLRYGIRGGVTVQAPITNIDGNVATELSIHGLGSTLDTGVLTIGIGADHQGALLVGEGANLLTTVATLGLAAGGLFSDPAVGTVALSEGGSWETGETLTIGGGGRGSISITTGAILNGETVVFVGKDAGSNGAITVNGEGSALTADIVSVGEEGTGNLMLQGGRCQVLQVLFVGTETGSNGAIALATGSLKTDSSVIGLRGTGSVTMNIGLFEATIMEIGSKSSGIGIVDVGPSEMQVTQRLTVGGQGSGTLIVGSGSIANVGQHDIFSDVIGKLRIGLGGILKGSGTIDAAEILLAGGVSEFTGGQIQPGNSPGTLTLEGDFTQELNSRLVMEAVGLGAGELDLLHVTGNATLGGTLEVHFLNGYLPRAGDVLSLLRIDGAVTGSFAHITFPNLLPGFQVSTELVGGAYKLTALNDAVLAPTLLLNISTRMQVGTGDNALIGGFILQGSEPKRILIRAIGPSLEAFGLSGAVADPTLELYDSTGILIGTNDNWGTTESGSAIGQEQVAEIQATGIAPSAQSESAIVATLDPGAYTAIVRGANQTTGVALVEVYDLGPAANPTKLANISTRGLVQSGDNVMIAGMIVGNQITDVLFRGIGPSLTAVGVSDALGDPLLELHDENGALLQSNDNWRDDQEAEIIATTLAPTDDHEAAILRLLAPGNYTAILRGGNDGTGVGLVEAYNVQQIARRPRTQSVK